MKITVLLDNKKITQNINKNVERAQKALDSQVLADSNFFIPKDTGLMEKSGILKTVLGSGRVRWVTDYVRRQYYGKYKHTHSKNPNGCGRWFEAAKSRFLKNWEALVNGFIKHN